MKRNQLMVGFDVAVDLRKVAAALAEAFDAEVEIGQGVTVNGLQPDVVFVHNKKRRNGKR